MKSIHCRKNVILCIIEVRLIKLKEFKLQFKCNLEHKNNNKNTHSTEK